MDDAYALSESVLSCCALHSPHKRAKLVQIRPKTVQTGRNRPKFHQIQPTVSQQYQLLFFFVSISVIVLLQRPYIWHCKPFRFKDMMSTPQPTLLVGQRKYIQSPPASRAQQVLKNKANQ